MIKCNFYFLTLFLFQFAVCNLAVAQEMEIDGFDFQLRKVNTNSKNFEVYSSPFMVSTGPETKKIQIRFRIKSISGKRENFDPNKFYIISEENKIRFRPVDMKYNYVAHTYYTFGYLMTEKLEKKSLPYYVSYNPEVKDTFKDYQIPEYTDIETRINFGTERKPILSCIYFDNKKLRSNIVDAYFAIPDNLNLVTVYYGDQKIEVTSLTD